MRYEIEKHYKKLKQISKLSDAELSVAHSRVLSRIHFINEELIPEKRWIEAGKLISDIDVDDIDFVALTNHLKGFLWTGDKPLYNGLRKKGFKKVLTTSDLQNKRRSKKE